MEEVVEEGPSTGKTRMEAVVARRRANWENVPTISRAARHAKHQDEHALDEGGRRIRRLGGSRR